MTKLVLISFNGRARLFRVRMQPGSKVRIERDDLARFFGIRRGDCIVSR